MGQAQWNALRGHDDIPFDAFPNFQPMQPTDPRWAPKSTECHECMSNFDIWTWRHHCRVCGQNFCSRCCYPRKLFHDEEVCGMCVAQAMVALREMYTEKRKRQVSQHFATYHPGE